MYYIIRDAKIYYEIVGEGMPVLMLHGCYPDHELMKGCMEPCFANKNGFQRIYIDLPGMGKSDAPEWIKSSEDILHVILAFIKEVIKERKFLIMGESYGGYLARGVLLHCKQQIQGMVLICPVVKPTWEDRTCPPEEVIIKDEEFISSLSEEQKELFCDGAVIQNKYVFDRFMNEINIGIEKANAEFITAFQKEYAFPFDVDDAREARFEKPVLILTGRQDSCVGYEDQWKLLDNYPRASYACIDIAGHNLQIENSMVLNCLVEDWIGRVER